MAKMLLTLAACLALAVPASSTTCEVVLPWAMQPDRIASDGTTVFVGGSGSMLWTVDATVPSTPALAGSLSTGWIQDIELAGGLVYLALPSSVLIVDASDVTAPALLGTLSLPAESIRGVGVSGTRLLVAMASGVLVADVSDPTAPSTLGTWSQMGGFQDLVVDPTRPDQPVAVRLGGLALYLQIFDISAPSAPATVGSSRYGGQVVGASTSYPMHGRLLRPGLIAVSASIWEAGMVDTEGIVWLFEVLPSSIVKRGDALGFQRSWDIEPWTSTTALWTVDGAMQLLSFADVNDPVVVEQLAIGNPGDIAIAGGEAYFGNTALSHMDLDCAFAHLVSAPLSGHAGLTASLRATPSPFRSRTSLDWYVPRATRVDLAVFDVSGRRVRTLVDGTVQAGWHRSDWAPSADAGFSGGVYLISLDTAEGRATRKVVRVR
jgi:hypothetical protein